MNASTILDRISSIINRDDFDRTIALEKMNNLMLDVQNESNFVFMEYLDTSTTLVTDTQSHTEPTGMKSHTSVYIEDGTNSKKYWLTEYDGSEADRLFPNTNPIFPNPYPSFIKVSPCSFLNPCNLNISLGVKVLTPASSSMKFCGFDF